MSSTFKTKRLVDFTNESGMSLADHIASANPHPNFHPTSGGGSGSSDSDFLQHIARRQLDGSGNILDGSPHLDISGNQLFAGRTHRHDGVYAPVNHNHDDAYASVTHNHNDAYATTDHNHDNVYASVVHNHNEYADVNHDHDDRYVLKGDNAVSYIDLTKSPVSSTWMKKSDGTLSGDTATYTVQNTGWVLIISMVKYVLLCQMGSGEEFPLHGSSGTDGDFCGHFYFYINAGTTIRFTSKGNNRATADWSDYASKDWDDKDGILVREYGP